MKKTGTDIFEINNNMYFLRYEMDTIQKIERVTGKSIVDSIQAIPTIDLMIVLLSDAIFNEDENKLSAASGKEIAIKLIKKDGLVKAFERSVSQIYEDCGFLFLNA